MSRPKHPCKQDCPSRTGECKITCPDWHEYEKAHALYLKEKDEDWKKRQDVILHSKGVHRSILKRGGR